MISKASNSNLHEILLLFMIVVLFILALQPTEVMGNGSKKVCDSRMNVFSALLVFFRWIFWGFFSQKYHVPWIEGLHSIDLIFLLFAVCHLPVCLSVVVYAISTDDDFYYFLESIATDFFCLQRDAFGSEERTNGEVLRYDASTVIQRSLSEKKNRPPRIYGVTLTSNLQNHVPIFFIGLI